MRRAMCLYMPYLATDRTAFDIRPPAEAERPLLLTRSNGATVLVAHACPRCLAAGIRPGMPVAEARAVLPTALVLPHEPQHDATTLEHLRRWAQRFSPQVQGVPPNVLLLDVTGCERLFRGEANIVRQATTGLTTRRIDARAAIADTVSAAWALTHAGDEPACVVPSGRTSAYLVGLPPSALRLEEKTVAALDALGIRSIGDLLMLPRASLPARFGGHLVLRLQQVLGEVPEPICSPRPAPVFSAQMPFGPTDQFEVVLAALERVVTMLCEQLVAGGVAVRGVLCVIYFEQREPVSSEVGLSRPSRDPKHLRCLLTAHIERIDLSAGTTGLRVTATETAVWRAVQQELFTSAERPDDEAIGTLIDRLADRLGHHAVVWAEVVDDHQPEKAFRYVPYVRKKGRSHEATEARRDEGNGAATVREREEGKKGRSHEATKPRRGKERKDEGTEGASDRTRDINDVQAGERPLRLFPRPVPVRVMALVPEGPPTWFHYRGIEHIVACATGPERLETGWWRGADVRRDYFRVTTERGQQFWLFRDLKSREWFVHGSYG